jgi:hypothetical protein
MMMIMTVSRAAFTDATSNDSNEAQAGTVYLTSDRSVAEGDNPIGDDTSDPMFVISTDGPFTPGESVSHCIDIQFVGDIEANVALDSVTVTGTNLPSYVDLQVETAASGTNCAAGTWDDKGTSTLDGTFVFTDQWLATPSVIDSMAYRLTLTLDDLDPADPGYAAFNSVQGESASIDFEWTATSN